MDRLPSSPRADMQSAPDGFVAAQDQGRQDLALSPEGPAAESLADGRALDAWLGHALRRLHDPVLSEPVPDHLLLILKAREEH
jgi:hypothetical protein